MRALVYEAIVSSDGYYEGPDGRFDWAAPDAELHAYVNARQEDDDTYLFGRRMYETMRVWDDLAPGDLPEVEAEFQQIWKTKRKLVASRTLEEVGPGAALLEGELIPAVEALKRQPGKSISVGGGEIAAPLIRAGLVDVFSLFVLPVAVGGGKSYWPADIGQIDLELTDSRTFANGAVHLLYRRK